MTIKLGMDKCPYCDGKGYYYKESSHGMELIRCSCRQNMQTNKMTEHVKIKCDDCKFVDDCVDYGWEGCKKFTQKASEAQTNEEWFAGLSTKEKAKVLANATYSSACLATEILFFGKEGEQKKWGKWLEQPHREE
jgi:hypothetical protein